MTVVNDKGPKMTSREEFRFLSDLVLTRSSADHTIVRLRDHHAGTTRFANNQVIQNVDARRGSLAVTVAFGGQQGPPARRILPPVRSRRRSLVPSALPRSHP
ncbi:MAG: hypothetical protein HC938_09905 [Nitrospira sp.]|nr:hypothetical protein [Nitrospira sp.]